MLQNLFDAKTLDRLKGTLCFSSNFGAVVFVPDVDSIPAVFDWNVLTDSDRFADFQRLFDLRSGRVENSFYIDASASDVSRWRDQQSGSEPEFVPRHSETSGAVDITSASMIPAEWQNSPIEVFINAVNMHVIGQSRNRKLCLISCDKHSNELSRNISNLDLIEIARRTFRDSSKRSLTGLIKSNGIRHAILLGHAGCGFSPRSQEAAEIFDALLTEGWSAQAAQDYLSPRFPIVDELSILRNDYHWLKRLWSSVTIAPLFINRFTKTLQLADWYATSDGSEHALSEPLFLS
jgi:hypothetical protein